MTSSLAYLYKKGFNRDFHLPKTTRYVRPTTRLYTQASRYATTGLRLPGGDFDDVGKTRIKNAPCYLNAKSAPMMC